MTTVRALCGGAGDPAGVGEFDKDVRLDTHHSGNIRLEAHGITSALLRNVSPLGADLLDLAAYVYILDTSVRRGGEVNLDASGWPRQFRIVMPVREAAVWTDPAVNSELSTLLGFLSGDTYEFEFVEEPMPASNLVLEFPDAAVDASDVGPVMLFSGGLDSLCAAAEAIVRHSARPILVSHRSSNRTKLCQQSLVQELKNHTGVESIHHIPVTINHRHERARDFHQRARSFLYLTLAAVVANETGQREIIIAENGPVSLNVPLAEEVVGTMATHSTHPEFVHRYRKWISKACRTDFAIRNPLFDLKKSEVVSRIESLGIGDLIGSAVSCAHPHRRPTNKPHCGTCSQCIDRRFATVAADLEHRDPVNRYELDIFYDQIPEGSQTQIAIDYLKWACDISWMDTDRLLARYEGLYRAANYMPGDLDANAEQIAGLLIGHANEVVQTMAGKTNERYQDLVLGRLPPDCLVAMAGERLHNIPGTTRLFQSLKGRLTSSLRIAFQREPPTDETDLQDKMQAALVAHEDRIAREAPAIPYSVVRTRPDFSTGSGVFIEAKYVRARHRLSQVVGEMNSDCVAYLRHARAVLFVVWAAPGIIADHAQFAEPFLAMDGVDVLVVP